MDWDRVHHRDIQDVDFTFSSLHKEMIRHHFWHVAIDAEAIERAKSLGVFGLRETAQKVITQSVGAAAPFRDGWQTPREGSKNPVHYAQHATASCCRKCIEEWHGIEQGRNLTALELEYLADLALRFLRQRIPEIGT